MKSNEEVRVQFLMPEVLLEKQRNFPAIFLPVGPLEWHGQHMSPGVDPLNAEFAAEELARRTSAVTLPTMYIGTECARPPEVNESLGFERDELVIGMDFPTIKDLFKSFYFSEDTFRQVLSEQIQMCFDNGYRYVFIINGHGAVNHNRILREICEAFSNSEQKVHSFLAFPDELLESGSIAHAGHDETSLMMFLAPEVVELDKLPDIDTPLPYKKHAIVDPGGFDGSPGVNFSLPDAFDPRTLASAELGKKLFKQTVEDIYKHIRKIID